MLFVIGATGRMGGAVIAHAKRPCRAASRSGEAVEGAAETARFDLDDAATHGPALAGCDALFVMRPPRATSRAPFDRLMEAARGAGIAHAFLRPADFMQNLASVHGNAIREAVEIKVPAGRGSSAFLDVEDIGHATAAILADEAANSGAAYDVTGPDALSFAQVARTMTEVLGREVRYRPISVPRFVLAEIRCGRPASMAFIISALYTVQRLGKAAPVRPDFGRLTGRRSGDLAGYVRRERERFG